MKDIERIKESLRENEKFREKFYGVKSLEEAILLSQEMGFQINKSDVENDNELSENFLESVAGGKGDADVQDDSVSVFVAGKGSSGRHAGKITHLNGEVEKKN